MLTSENENLVSIAGSAVICNSQGWTGQTRITANLPYSGISSSFDINVQCCYLKAGLETIVQNENEFLINLPGKYIPITVMTSLRLKELASQMKTID